MTLETIKIWFSDAVRRSGQQSHRRRYPGNELSVEFGSLKRDLDCMVAENHPELSSVVLTLSQVCECMLDYPRAGSHLRAYVDLTGDRSKKTLKRMAMIEEAIARWKLIAVTPPDLELLRQYIDIQMAKDGASKEFSHSCTWLEGNGYDKDLVVEGFRALGLSDDFQVAANLP
jgi:hypothetical protein